MAHLCGFRSNRLPFLALGLALLSPTSLTAGPLDDGPELFSAPTASAAATISAELTADDSSPNEVVLTVEIDLPTGFYLPSMAKSNPKPTVIKLTNHKGLETATEWAADHEPKKSREPAPGGGGLVEVEKYFDKVTFSRRLTVTPGASDLSAELVFDAQYCSTGGGGTCNLLIDTVPVSLEVESSEPLPFELRARPTVLGGPYPGEAHVKLAPQNAKPGDKVTLSVTVTLDDPWHVYSTTMEEQIGGLPTVIAVEPFGLEALGDDFTTESEPMKHDNEFDEGLVLEYFEKSVTWTRSFKVTDDRYGVSGSIRYQTCADGIGCKPPATVEFAVGGVAAAPPAAVEQPVAREPGAEPDPGAVEAVAPRSSLADMGLLTLVLLAAAAGFAALLTPCVFPMVPITVSFFLKQSEKEHVKPVALASVYALGIITTFTVLGVIVAAIMKVFFQVEGSDAAFQNTDMANNSGINIFLAGILVFFGLNMLGLFEIRLPSKLVNWSAAGQNRGGYVGTLFMALTFTLMSFTCTFAFAGGLIALAVQGHYLRPIIGMLAFSTAFALPFFLLALFPSWLQKLPKSGGWMNTVKVTMGMIELGAAVKFLSVAELSWFKEPVVFDHAFVLSAWAVISICTGLYLLGMFRLGHDTPTEHISVPRLGFAMLFLMLAAYLSVGLFAPKEPEGVIWDQITVIAPPTGRTGGDGDVGPYQEVDGVKYALDIDRALEYAAENGQPLFLDFTGVNCPNCRLMERKMSKDPRVHGMLDEFVTVQLYLDTVPVVGSEEGERLLKRNRQLAVDWLGDVTMPSYAIVGPDGELLQGVTPFTGVERSSGEFAQFLERGIRVWRQAERDSATKLAER